VLPKVLVGQQSATFLLAFLCLLDLSIDAFQRNAFASFRCDAEYGRKHGISNRLVLVAQGKGWFQSYALGTANHVIRPDCG
jgi:hypothetical protein